MPENSPADNVEKLISDQKALEERKQALIADLLKQREAVMNDFDQKLAKLGYKENSSRSKRSHHRNSASAPSGAAEASAKKDKTKA